MSILVIHKIDRYGAENVDLQSLGTAHANFLVGEVTTFYVSFIQGCQFFMSRFPSFFSFLEMSDGLCVQNKVAFLYFFAVGCFG